MSMADEILVRSAPAGKTSWNPETRTLELIVSAFADCPRYGYIERLSRAPADWNLSRVSSPGGVPFLDGHNTWSGGARLGRVQSAAIGKDDIRAVVKLNNSASANALVREIEAGTPPGVSFGYSVGRWQLAEDDENAKEIRIAKEISLLEVSAVSVAADPGAHIRSREASMQYPLNSSFAPAPTVPATSTPPEDQEARDLDPVEAERDRVSQINALARRLKINPSMADRAIAVGTSVEKFRAAVLDAMADEQDETPIRSHAQPGYHSTLDNPAFRILAMSEALAHRVAPDVELSGPARQFAGLPLAEIARRCLEFRGEQTAGLSPATLIMRSLHTTSDFPQILADTVNRRLRAAYQAAPSAIKQLASKSTAKDFRAKHSLLLSEAGRLEKVNEHGEYESTTFEESGESYRIATYGRIFGITRQALINDDLTAFDSMPRKLGAAAEAFEARFLADLIASNPKMSDNKAVFHVDHSNLASVGTALSIDSLSAARLAMRKQVGLSSQYKRAELISVTPRFLLVPPDLETKAEQVLAEIAASAVADVNPFSKKLALVVEPRLADPKAWYISASPSEIDTIEYAYLEGTEGPQIETEQGFDIDGMRFKVRQDFGAAFLDWRGVYKNPGQ